MSLPKALVALSSFYVSPSGKQKMWRIYYARQQDAFFVFVGAILVIALRCFMVRTYIQGEYKIRPYKMRVFMAFAVYCDVPKLELGNKRTAVPTTQPPPPPHPDNDTAAGDNHHSTPPCPNNKNM